MRLTFEDGLLSSSYGTLKQYTIYVHVHIVFSLASAPVKASICSLEYIAFPGGACTGDYGMLAAFHFTVGCIKTNED